MSRTSPSATRCAGSPGCRTELEDITEVEYRQLRLERVVLVGVWTEGTRRGRRELLAELALLAETAGSRGARRALPAAAEARPGDVRRPRQGRRHRARSSRRTGADTVICDGELAPSQLRNLEDRLKVKVVDRTALILDIFAQHAKSQGGPGAGRAGPAQLHEAAAPRLGRQLSRQAGGRVGAAGGGIGGRGPGETKIETDRRRINTKIAKLRRELKDMKGTRDTKRQERRRNQIPSVSHRRLHQRRQVLAAQPAHRRRGAGRGLAVRDARPDHAAYDDHRRPGLHDERHRRASSGTCRTSWSRRSARTLEEVADSDLILHVVDGSHPDPEGQLAAVREVFAEIGADRGARAGRRSTRPTSPTRWWSPGSGSASRTRSSSAPGPARASPTRWPSIEDELPRPGVEFSALLPYERGDLINRLHQHGEIASMEHTADGTLRLRSGQRGPRRRARGVRRLNAAVVRRTSAGHARSRPSRTIRRVRRHDLRWRGGVATPRGRSGGPGSRRRTSPAAPRCPAR